MSAPTDEVCDVPAADEFDVIAACQLWLELDFPDQAAADHSASAPVETGGPR
ncbi:hypothetical protein [Catenulispora pinisilvae]|uniref:hypothetical protein n=1 Tax=Catenulispora pinisilvae TaxID=2705253 RepID=UPI0018927BD3|nr:hypothetical protein [Catenulispora pinisilvae]